MRRCRKPTIVADAAHWILTSDSRTTTGNFFTDEDVLRESGASDFDQDAVDPTGELLPDFFL